MIIAIDGPAGSGKSSTARAVAARLGFSYLDSGAFYRAVTYAALSQGIAQKEWAQLDADALDRFGVHAEAGPRGFEFFADGRDITQAIRSPEVNANVSRMAAVPAVRTWLMDRLRAAGRNQSLVADGRDIGTVVFPDAELKIFLVADPAERARRRLAEMGKASPTKEEVQSEIERLSARDRTDSSRETAPLRKAEDAVVIDTTDLSFDEQVERIVELAIERRKK
jgi:cytidylate kinase